MRKGYEKGKGRHYTTAHKLEEDVKIIMAILTLKEMRRAFAPQFSMKHLIHPGEWRLLLRFMRFECDLDNETDKFKIPSLALKMGYSIS